MILLAKLKVSNSKPGSLQNLEVLVVDDDKIARLLHQHHLRTASMSNAPVSCAHGKEALDYLLKNDVPNKHFLVLLDLNMPVVNGWEFLDFLEKTNLTARVLVVIITSSINNRDREKAQKYKSVIHFCSKPLDTMRLQKIKSLEVLKPYFDASKNSSEE